MAAQISFERPFKHVFQDPNWTKKILMGGLFLLIPLVGAFVYMGYQKRYYKMLMEDPNAQMPEIDFGNDLSAGLPIFGIYFCYYLAIMIIAVIPLVGQLVASLGQIVFAGIIPLAVARYYKTEKFGSAFEFGALIDFIKANFNNCALFTGIAVLAGIAAGLGTIACIVGVVFTMFWAGNVTTIALADVYRAADEPAPATPAAPPSNDAPPAP
ncbi:MAG TPA: DUF4013 domain-containing protein [Myxococcales bacterium]|jgi:hypothetical protein